MCEKSSNPVHGSAGRATCPDENYLAGYAEGGLTQAESFLAEEHFSACSRCRERLLFAATAAPSEAPALEGTAAAPAQKRVRICVAVKDALDRVESLFEDSIVLLTARFAGETVPVFRGEDGNRETSVRLGPFELRLQRDSRGGAVGLDIGVTKQRQPLVETWTTFMLSSGRKVEARTDSRGWLHVADIALDQIDCIWINATL